MLIVCHLVILTAETILGTENDLNFLPSYLRIRKTKFFNSKCVPKICVLAQELNLFGCYGKYIFIFQMDASELINLMIFELQMILLSPFTSILFFLKFCLQIGCQCKIPTKKKIPNRKIYV